MNEIAKIGIVLQGPTSYYKKIIDCYKSYPYLVWSTWQDEPIENIIAIREAGILLILIEKPKFTGNWNVNLQCKSTIEGVLFLKKKFSFLNYFIKVRSDFTISNIFLLASRFHELNTPISFLGGKNCYGSITVLDFVLGGNAESLKLFFKLEDYNDIGFTYPEVFLEKRYLENISEMETFSSRNRKQYFINLDNISIIWLKKKKELKYPDEYAFFLFDKNRSYLYNTSKS